MFVLLRRSVPSTFPRFRFRFRSRSRFRLYMIVILGVRLLFLSLIVGFLQLGFLRDRLGGGYWMFWVRALPGGGCWGEVGSLRRGGRPRGRWRGKRESS